MIVHEERARRVLWSSEELETLEFPLRNDSFGFILGDQRMHFRFRSVFADERAEFVADIELIYSISEQVTFDEAIHREFAERVAFMAVYPFIRTSIFGAAGRLSLPAPILGIVRQGEFSLGEKMTEDQAHSAFADVASELHP
ncbi:hypothetical protein [Microbacterium sp. SS28]|uniref:hypothetical protein n=1 Tax=Microbacterium sp. SS28 TaxID=2919948 RepID=UPI001FAAE1F4|nr:hypothetical protein [Microbacterium sp. SS28]